MTRPTRPTYCQNYLAHDFNCDCGSKPRIRVRRWTRAIPMFGAFSNSARGVAPSAYIPPGWWSLRATLINRLAFLRSVR